MSSASVSFIKTTVIGGLIVVIPLSLIIIIFGDLFVNLVAIAQPIAKYLPFNELLNTIIVAVLAVGGIFLLCFGMGI